MGMIEVDLFSEDVDNEDHPEAAKLKTLLVAAAAEFSSELLAFEVNRGTVAFSFSSDELTAEILTILQHDDKS